MPTQRVTRGGDRQARTVDKAKKRANPPHGQKGEFRKLSMTLPPDAYEALMRESTRRKIAKEPNHVVSAMLREAVSEYLYRRGFLN
jgi:hypothetical protein